MPASGNKHPFYKYLIYESYNLHKEAEKAVERK